MSQERIDELEDRLARDIIELFDLYVKRREQDAEARAADIEAGPLAMMDLTHEVLAPIIGLCYGMTEPGVDVRKILLETMIPRVVTVALEACKDSDLRVDTVH